jgi:alginate O-acetyltransferase complex protein AlgJ
MKTDHPLARLPAVLTFLVVITLPLAVRIMDLEPEASWRGKQKMEQGKRGSSDSLATFFQRRGRDFTEQLFLRGTLIHANNSLKYMIFGVSGVPKVIIGKQGWLFQARVNADPGTAGYFVSIGPFSSEELEQWKKSLQERQRWLKDRGIAYLFIPVPDKSSIYPEYLPDNLRDFYRHSRLDQLIEFLKKNSDLPVLDIRPALLEAKKRFPVYAKTDSHWSEGGARIVFGEIRKLLSLRFAEAKNFALPECRMEVGRKRSGGNLAMMLTLENSFFMEERSKAFPNVPSRAEKSKLPPVRFPQTVAAEATRNAWAPLASAVFFHDSFGRRLKPYLSELFARIVFIRDWGFRLDGAVIEKERPGTVLDEIAEHFLYNVKLVNDLPGKNGI